MAMDSVSELHGGVDSIQSSLILLLLPPAITECRLCLSARHYEGFIKICKPCRSQRVHPLADRATELAAACTQHPVAVQHKQCAKVLMPRTTTK